MHSAGKYLIPRLVVPLLIALGAMVPLFYQIVVLAPQQPDNLRTFYSYESGGQSYAGLPSAWKTRLFSNALAWQVDRFSAALMSARDIRYINRPQPFAIGLWTIGWFFLVSMVYVWFLGQRSVFYILGTYAALTFGYVDKLPATRVYPWDMPALLVYTLFLFLFLGDRFRWILLLLPLGMGFKETTGVLAISFLLSGELSRKSRWWMFVAGVGLCAAVKIAIDLSVGVTQPFLTMETGLGGSLAAIYVIQNLSSLASLQPLLINAGTLLSFVILPTPNQKIQILKIVAVFFALGNFLFGTLLEYRIWFEMIPFALYAIETTARRDEPESSAVQRTGPL